MSAVAGAAVVLVVVTLLAACAFAWSMVQRARQRSREINAQIVEIHTQLVETAAKLVEMDAKFVETYTKIDESHLESHRTIHAVNKRLDHLARIEQFARIDRAASAVHQAASEGRLPAVARKKLIAHLDEVRDELSASEPGA